MLRILTIIIFFYFLVLLQTSFLIHFNIVGGLINYIIILIPLLVISFLTPQNQREDIVAAFSAGFFLDIFSGQPIGVSILIFLSITLFVKFILKKHINLPLTSNL